MPQLTYQRPGSRGVTRVRLSRRRRRVLAVLLTSARNLHGFRLCEAAQVGPGCLYPLLAHLEAADWVTRDRRKVGGQGLWCYSLTERGRLLAAEALRLYY